MKVEQQRRVLVVDDEPGIRELLVRTLRRHELIVDEANDGAEALVRMREHQYAVIILDLLMPVLDGVGVVEALAGLPSPPVVLVITGASRREIDQLNPRLVHGIVRKPFDAEELASVVVACAEIRSRNSYGAMAIATMIAGSPLLAWLNRLSN